ncbi:MAG: type II secretion system protein [Rhodospirillales bacterium]|nr:type II secretion system protein [Rhodospirillales bacterium]MCB9995841.1 type II secretion system protein [Rhodospirillales bacterium]
MIASNQKKPTEAGFTLIEMALITIITGLLFAAVVRLYGNYLANEDRRETVENLSVTLAALDEFYGTQGRYPCPADPTLGPGDVNFGLEDCACPAGIACLPDLVFTSAGNNRDVDNDGNDDPVMIGAVPVQTLIDNIFDTPFVSEHGNDGYNMKLSYAVSALMTNPVFTLQNPANPNMGAISVKDKLGKDAVDPEGSAHYVVFSHGVNNVGAYTKEGDYMGGCFIPATTNPIPPGFTPSLSGSIENEKENCDNNDAIFIKEIQSMANTNDYYDDILFIGMNLSTSLWRNSLFQGNEVWLYNTNLGDVGVGNTNPTAALEVTGDLKTESYTQSEFDYCDSATGVECLDPVFLGGTTTPAAQNCPNGEAAIAIENNALVCAPVFSSLPAGIDCSGIPGTYLRGFSNLGSVDCVPP